MAPAGDKAVRSLVAEIVRALRDAGDPQRAVQEKRYLKSPVTHYGTTVPAIRRTVHGALRGREALTRRFLLDVVRRLWSSDVHEQRMAAVIALQEHQERLEPRDLGTIEEMIRGSFTWAYVDVLAASVAGALLERNPELADELDRWAKDESFWVRRSALLALMLALREGRGDWRRFTRYADGMLDETEFFIRKAIGWVLRETSKKRPDRVTRFVASRLDRLSGVSFREAVRRLPPADKNALERAYRARKG